MKRSNSRTKTTDRAPRRVARQSRPANPSKNGNRRIERAPVSYGFKTKLDDARFITRSSKQTILHHKEFVTSVTGSTNFSTTSFPVNPGRDTCFKWLSTIATQYEQYEFTKLKFTYEPRCSTATSGEVLLVFDTDAGDSAPSTQQAAYAYSKAAPASPWQEVCLSYPVADLTRRGPLFTRAGAVPSGKDVKTYDIGTLYLCTSGFTGAVASGVLLVEYEVRLFVPQTSNNVQSLYIDIGTSALDASHLFGNGVKGLLDATVTGNDTITFQQEGTWQVSWVVLGTGLTAPATQGGTATYASGISQVNAGATQYNGSITVTAKRGDTMTFTLGAMTTITASTWRFGPFNVNE